MSVSVSIARKSLLKAGRGLSHQCMPHGCTGPQPSRMQIPPLVQYSVYDEQQAIQETTQENLSRLHSPLFPMRALTRSICVVPRSHPPSMALDLDQVARRHCQGNAHV
jgi:hypothetical protein